MSVGLVVKPLIAGFKAISLMPVRSAPSANSFTPISVAVPIALVLVYSRKAGEDAPLGFGQRFYRDIGRGGALFTIAVIDEEARASCGLACSYVTPPVAHHEAGLEVDT